MKKLTLLLFSLLLFFFSSQGLANNGDVYYCEMKSFTSMSSYYESYDVKNFKFKWDNNNLIFSDDFISISKKKLVLMPYPSDSVFTARSPDDVFFLESLFYVYGNFLYSLNSTNAVFTVIAECDKF